MNSIFIVAEANQASDDKGEEVSEISESNTSSNRIVVVCVEPLGIMGEVTKKRPMLAASLIYLLWSTTGKGMRSSHSAKNNPQIYDHIRPKQKLAKAV